MSNPRMYPVGADEAGNPVMTKIRRYTVSFTAGEVAANTVENDDVTVSGVAAGDVLIGIQTPANSTATGVVGARVKAANTIELRFINPTAGALTPTAGTYEFLVATYE